MSYRQLTQDQRYQIYASMKADWSMRGADNLVLIGRAEQVDTAYGLATSYACQNCCPDNFISALATDCGVPTYVQDTSALTGREQDQDCHGST